RGDARLVLAALAAHGVGHAADATDLAAGKLDQVGHALRHFVGLDLLGLGGALAVLDHHAVAASLGFEVVRVHVGEAVFLHKVAAVGGVADDLVGGGDAGVQQFLGAFEVVHHADGRTATENREERDHGEVVVGAPVVVQDHVLRGHGPADAANGLADQHGAGFLGLLDALRVGVLHVSDAAGREHRDGGRRDLPVLAVHHAVARDVGALVNGVVHAIGGVLEVVTEAVALHAIEVFTEVFLAHAGAVVGL